RRRCRNFRAGGCLRNQEGCLANRQGNGAVHPCCIRLPHHFDCFGVGRRYAHRHGHRMVASSLALYKIAFFPVECPLGSHPSPWSLPWERRDNFWKMGPKWTEKNRGTNPENPPKTAGRPFTQTLPP